MSRQIEEDMGFVRWVNRFMNDSLSIDQSWTFVDDLDTNYRLKYYLKKIELLESKWLRDYNDMEDYPIQEFVLKNLESIESYLEDEWSIMRENVSKDLPEWIVYYDSHTLKSENNRFTNLLYKILSR